MEPADRPKTGEVERRTATAGVVDGKRVYGLVPYNVKASLGGFTEEIAPGALRGAKLDGLVAVIDHEDRGLPLARYPRSLQVEHRDDGLGWSFELPRSRQDVVEALERGDVAGSSWRMVVAEERWDGDHRTVTRIAELKDITLAGSQQPVYPTTVEYRTHHDGGEGRQKEQAMAEQADMKDGLEAGADKQDEHRTERPAAGSLRVEERAEAPLIHSLADLYEQRGFFENRTASVSWDEFRSFVWSAGTVLTDLNPVRREGVPLGYDVRWLYPVLPTTAVDAATTSVQYLRQTGRALAGTAVIRAIDSTSTKPETSGTAELATLQLSQVATVNSGIPRIHAAQPLFQSLVEQDLRLAIGDGLDEIVRRGVVNAGTAAGVTGDIVAKIRKARTVVEAAGYRPNVLAIDPAGAEALDLLVTGISGGTSDYVFEPGQPAPAVWGLQRRVWKSPGTALIDGDAFGRLYVSPMELRSFEADGGLTNRQNVRLECNAGFAVERPTAGLRII